MKLARTFALSFSFLAAATLLSAACGTKPELDVETADPDRPAAAAQSPGAPVAPQSAHTPAAEDMPEGHPPVDLPADHPPLGAGGQPALELAPVDPSAGRGEAAITWQAPTSWIAEPPSSSMRRAQFRVPGPGGDGECVVFYFGPGQGGDPKANAERWASQFLDASGQPARDTMKTREVRVDGIDVLWVEAAGTYQAGSMMGMGQGTPKPGWALLGAIASGPDANWFFKLTGPAATVETHRDDFDAMIQSLRPGG